MQLTPMSAHVGVELNGAQLAQMDDAALAEVKRLAQAHADELAARIAEMHAMQRTLQDLAAHCHGDARPECPILDDLAGKDPPP